MPVVVFRDPFRGSPNIIVLTECWNADKTPCKFNYRREAAELMKKHAEREPWFGLDQDYTLVGLDDRSSPATGLAPGSPWPHYCGVGAGKVVLRDIVESHYKACLYAGVKISGTNAEVMPGRWNYQVGGCPGIESESTTLFFFL